MSSKARLSSPKKPLFEIQTNDERLLTKQEVADFLGVSVKTIDKKVMLNEIPFYKIGKLVRFSKTRVIDWVESVAQPAG